MVASHTQALVQYCKEHLLDEALQTVDHLAKQRIPVSRDTAYHLLQGCIRKKDLAATRLVYSLLVSSGLDTVPVLGDHLLRLFASCGSLFEANKVFQKISKPSVYTWNAIISAHANLGECARATALYHQMQHTGVRPDRVTYLSVLKICSTTGALGQVRLIHDEIGRDGLGLDIVIGSALVDVYAKCGNVEEARKVFDKLLNRNVVSWGAMMEGYAQQGCGLLALELFDQMQLEGINPNRVIFLCMLKACSSIGAITQGMMIHEQIIRSGLQSDMGVGNTLVDLYSKCGNLEEARKVFDELPVHSVISWGAMIAGYTRHGHVRVAVQCLETMQGQGLKPDDVIFTCILAACSHAGLLQEGYQCFKSMTEHHGIVPNIEHYSCMVDLLGRVGRLNEATEFIQSMPILSDGILLTSLLTSCRHYGNVEIGRQCFHQLIGLDPNDASWYVLMSNIYAEAYMWEAAGHMQELKKHAGAWRKAGRAWIEDSNKVQEFMVGSKIYTQDVIYVKLHRLNRLLRKKGNVPQVDGVLELMYLRLLS